jgi:putative membrane protein
MLRLLKHIELNVSILIIAFFTVGLGLHLSPYTQKYVLAITDITMLLTNSLVLYFLFREQENKKLLYWSISAFILTYLTELAGVRTGLIFGDYYYGDTMKFQIFNVPVVIGMNWVILMLGTYSISQSMKLKSVFVPLVSSLLIVVFDFIMEDVAVKLDYWQWTGNEIPFKNYVAWFVISLIFSGLLHLLEVKVNNRLIKIYVFVQLGFFIGLRMFLD